MNKAITKKLLRARDVLNQTIQRILEINRTKKALHNSDRAEETGSALNEELKVLNKIVEQQAWLVKKYETELALQKI